MLTIDITEVQKGDIVRFKAYALRVEQEPQRTRSSIRLEGRTSIDGSPTVSKWFLRGKQVKVERSE